MKTKIYLMAIAVMLLVNCGNENPQNTGMEMALVGEPQSVESGICVDAFAELGLSATECNDCVNTWQLFDKPAPTYQAGSPSTNVMFIVNGGTEVSIAHIPSATIIEIPQLSKAVLVEQIGQIYSDESYKDVQFVCEIQHAE